MADNPDCNFRNYASAGLTVLSESPFFPVIYGIEEEAVVAFNQGYIFNYLETGPSLQGKATQTTTVELLKGEKADGTFYLQINGSGGAIYSAKIVKGTPDSKDDDKDVINIALCSLKNGTIEYVYLRENIHLLTTFAFLRPPEGATPEKPYFLAHDGKKPKWIESEECPEDPPPA